MINRRSQIFVIAPRINGISQRVTHSLNTLDLQVAQRPKKENDNLTDSENPNDVKSIYLSTPD